MKAVFTTNGDYASYSTHKLLKVAIKTLQENTTLTPVVIWDGMQDRMTGWLADRGVEIIYHQLSFKKDIENFNFKDAKCINQQLKDMYLAYPNYYNNNFIVTESMRMDIPDLFPNDEYVLYCDCDVMFLKDLTFEKFEEPLACVLRDSGFFNNGVMVFNLPVYRKYHEDFKKYFINSNYGFPVGNTTTQGAYNTFFYGKVHNLPENYNWHSFWGLNEEACIIHFCGPKPFDWKKMERFPQEYDIMYRCCITESFIRYAKDWFSHIAYEIILENGL